MRISIHWLRQYVDIHESPEELADMLTMLGFEAEVITDLSGITGVVTARIESVDKHPNADKLHLCQVTDGTETFSIVCGAPNVAAGQIVPLAKIDAKLPGDFVIKKAKIRGEVSFGMLCSERELGISDRHEGILILPSDISLGQDIVDVLRDQVSALELDITPNRPDTLSYIGIAREIAAKTNRTLHLPEIPSIEPETTDESIQVILDAPDGCPRYLAGIVTGLKVGPSPDWMVKHLEAAGQRSINNLVDISNYVLLELGHPTHIFDLDRFGSREVLVRFAQAGETFKTLDGDYHRLNSDHLLITNGKTPVALAGIMGGENSAVTDSTTAVLIESAYFDPVTIRKGSKSLGMLTEASRRFERGADPEAVVTAFYRIVDLLRRYADGTLASEVVDAYPNPITVNNIVLRKSETEHVTGLNLSDQQIESLLRGIHVAMEVREPGQWLCTPPSFRPDLTREIDLIEEVVRLYGYDQVEASHAYQGLFQAGLADPQAYLSIVRRVFNGLGFYECYNNSLVSAKIAHFNHQPPVSVMNPLTEQMTHVRTSLFPGLLANLQTNFNFGKNDVQLFEVGNIHLQPDPGFKGIKHQLQVCGVLTGKFRATHVHDTKEFLHNFFTGKGLVQTALQELTGEGIEFIPTESQELNPGFDLRLGDQIVGQYGEISNDLLHLVNCKTGAPVFGFTFYIETLAPRIEQTKKYHPVNPFPGIERDLNFVVDAQRYAGELETVIREKGGTWLKSITPMDVFTHASLGPGKKSILFRLFFQSDSKTLEDSEVNPIIDRIIKFADKEIGAKLRS